MTPRDLFFRLITKYGIDFIKNNNPGKAWKPFILYLTHESPYCPTQERHDEPAIISYPGKIKVGAVSTDPVLSIDFLPTFIDFARGKLTSESIDRIRIKNLLLHGDKLPKRNLFWSFGNKHAMHSGKWNLVSIKSHDKTTVELFDLENDLSEKND